MCNAIKISPYLYLVLYEIACTLLVQLKDANNPGKHILKLYDSETSGHI